VQRMQVLQLFILEGSSVEVVPLYMTLRNLPDRFAFAVLKIWHR